MLALIPADGEKRNDADQLSRTTLQAHESTSALALAQLVVLLQRVPGVLIAEAGPGTRTVVAHDAGVARSSLLDAAMRAGVVVKILAGPQAEAIGFDIDLKVARVWAMRAFNFALGTFIALSLLDKLAPGEKRWLLPGIVICTCLALCVGDIARRRRR